MFVGSSGQILLPRYLVNGLSSLDETCREYLLASTDDVIRFWRSKVKVTVAVNMVKASTLTLGQGHQSLNFVHPLVPSASNSAIDSASIFAVLLCTC